MPRGPHHHDGQSAVEVRREDYEAKWKVVHEAKWNAARARRTEAGKEDRTKGSAAGQLNGRLLRRFLEMAAHSLGDQRLVEAVEAVKFWKLDKKPYRSLRVAFNDRCLVQIDQLFLYGNGERSFSTILKPVNTSSPNTGLARRPQHSNAKSSGCVVPGCGQGVPSRQRAPAGGRGLISCD